MRPPMIRTWLRELLMVFYIPACMIALLFSLPYMLYRRSANYGLEEKDFAPVQLYLDHFERLQPELMAAFSRLSESPTTLWAGAGDSLRFWPSLERDSSCCCIPCVGSLQQTTYKSTLASRTFAFLEYCTFPRRTLYDFLEHYVEDCVPGITDEQKAAYRRVKQQVCTGSMSQLLSRALYSHSGRGFRLPKSDASGRIIPVRHKAIAWLVEPAPCFIAPMDWASFYALRRLARESGIWAVVQEEAELPRYNAPVGQVIDLR